MPNKKEIELLDYIVDILNTYGEFYTKPPIGRYRASAISTALKNIGDHAKIKDPNFNKEVYLLQDFNEKNEEIWVFKFIDPKQSYSNTPVVREPKEIIKDIQSMVNDIKEGKY